jgi:uncharacterized phage protein gp47/JayE
MGSYSPEGYTRKRLADWDTDLKALYRSIFGENIDLSADTQDGQLIGAWAETLSNQDMTNELLSMIINPNAAEKNWLSTLVKLNGIQRQGAASSTVELTFTGSNGVIIPSGTQVEETTNGEKFATNQPAEIIGGTATVSATALNKGPIVALSGTLTELVSQVSGIISVTNANDATLGRLEESDGSLRLRRFRSVALASTSLTDSVLAAIANLEGVINARVYENKTNATDSNGITAHSIAAVVVGGNDTEIAQTILQKMSLGGTFGSTTVAVEDGQGNAIDINFSRPTDVDIYIEMDVRKFSSFPDGGDDLIKAAIIDYMENNADTRLKIGDDVVYSSLFCPIMSVGGLSVTDLTIGTTASPTGKVDIPIGFDEIAEFDTSRITITTVS